MKLKYFEVKDRYHYYLHVPILTKPYCPFAESEYNKKKGGNTMANTSAVYARIDTNLKDNAESILSQLAFLHPVQFRCFIVKLY